MRIQLFSLFFFLGLSLNTSAYQYAHSELQSLSQLIDSSLKTHGNVDSILNGYQKFNRSTATAEDLTELKFQMSHWRTRTVNFLIQQALSEGDETKLAETLISLQKINVKISKEKLKELSMISAMHRSPAREAFSDLMSGQVDPQKKIKIVPIKPSSWPFEKWVKYPEFSHYKFEGDSIRYRGLVIKPGDILLTNLNHPGDGVYTAMCSPRSLFSHFSYVAFLEENGRRYPAAIEIYELGVRAIPLSVFLSPQFSPYLEIYRFKTVPENWHLLVNKKAKEMVHEVHAYNFYYEVDNERELSCTTVGTCIYRRTGIRPIQDKSDFEGKIWENVKKVGAGGSKLLTPTDYLMSDRLEFVGVMDNNYFSQEVTKELVLRRLRNLFETKTISQDNFPLEFKINRWGVNQIRAGSFLGNLFMWIEGFSRETFPKGPTDGMAIVEIFESATHKGVEQSKNLIEKEITPSLFSIHDLEEKNELQAKIDHNIEHIARWFKD